MRPAPHHPPRRTGPVIATAAGRLPGGAATPNFEPPQRVNQTYRRITSRSGKSTSGPVRLGGARRCLAESLRPFRGLPDGCSGSQLGKTTDGKLMGRFERRAHATGARPRPLLALPGARLGPGANSPQSSNLDRLGSALLRCAGKSGRRTCSVCRCADLRRE